MSVFQDRFTLSPTLMGLVGNTRIMNDIRINELCTNENIFILKQTIKGLTSNNKIYYSTTNKWEMYDFLEKMLKDTYFNSSVIGIVNDAVDKSEVEFDLSDRSKYLLTYKQNSPMIVNHSPTQVTQDDGKKVISYGTSSYGYDIRVDNKFKRFKKPAFSTDTLPIDPKLINPALMEEHTYGGDFIMIEPNSFVLANTVESFNIPPNVLVNCIGKSTYARCGIICIVTPLEPGWSGYLTLEFANTTNRPVKLYIGEGVAQLEFYESLHLPQVTYADRNGKYQNQDREPIIPRLK